MNDLHLDGVDLRAALHRDADLVGEPSPDLLDQLVRRRSHQRRQRAGLIAVAAAVAVIAAGIPVGASLVGRSRVAPATQTTTPSVTTEAAPTTPAAEPTATTPSTSTGRTTIPPTIPVVPDCPTGSQLAAVIPGQSSSHWFTPIQPEYVRCSGTWAVEFLNNTNTYVGEQHATGYTGLFQYVGGHWTAVDRAQLCPIPGRVPQAIYSDACETD